ncbi:uncharacterized protein PV09_01827 [Verruconis gallopava]|uniref:Myb-like domain-containing protein n=1 Tax=Verruconis gallopava TaxID=253628 RepID=A0A0D2AME6_9PEZI|nr:uncharacterized protein PV09_01827 [Verruconis gallopava]KIW07918.1 hypothetical protein PV09_01827 [Verruconis gallopava]
MEPRVSNLLLSEQSPTDRHDIDIQTVASGSFGAVFPTTALPAIRPLHEDQVFDARPYTNEIDSLTLPEIDWQAFTASLNPQQSTSDQLIAQNAQITAQEQAESRAKKPARSGAPIAEVLNQASPIVTNAQKAESREPEPRKRRRLDPSEARTLPKPSPAAKKSHERQLLPPLLAPLHEPPPDAALIPSMTTEVLRAPMTTVASRELNHDEKKPAAVSMKPSCPEKVTQKQPEEAQISQPTKTRRVRHNWTEGETSDLLRGVSQFGIGNWKKILDCPEYKFQNRTAVDLKDRFRTCCPEEYRKVGKADAVSKDESDFRTVESLPTRSNQKDTIKSNEADRPSKFEHRLPDELARLGISGPFPKAQRRARRGFTAEEDNAILRGFEKYGAKWTKIQSDPELGLSSRSRTDLRDRFRNRFPEKFVETGHKFKQRDAFLLKENNESEGASQISSEPVPVSNTSQLDAQHATAVAAQDFNLGQHSLKLLTTSIAEPTYFAEFGDITSETGEPGPITLSRNIFDWANQNTRSLTSTSSARADPNANSFELSNTITTMDQFHINPMLALKVPHHAPPTLHSGFRDGSTAVAPSNLFPQLPLSGILNGPVSLPSAAELVSGLEADGNT